MKSLLNKELYGIKIKYLLVALPVFIIASAIFNDWDNFKRGLAGESEITESVISVKE
ncbi:hypothetical protein [Carboxylicivirga linearis]|uniref:Uncharacterized protein n=1 Tax=Carboxylicivirga linearis TaxID=1628157 RepID=A0ABS5JQM3_9BACT|nr:hypothetical protein [Carboxylicivirga linearis]MBS2096781.1 hypothetical protein [Carboxylicivirga linearis]